MSYIESKYDQNYEPYEYGEESYGPYDYGEKSYESNDYGEESYGYDEPDESKLTQQQMMQQMMVQMDQQTKMEKAMALAKKNSGFFVRITKILIFAFLIVKVIFLIGFIYVVTWPIRKFYSTYKDCWDTSEGNINFFASGVFCFMKTTITLIATKGWDAMKRFGGGFGGEIAKEFTDVFAI